VIRIDIFFAMIVLGAVDGIAGLLLLAGARGRPDREALLVAGSLCVGVPALAIAGFVALKADSDDVARNLDLGHRFRFEAYFRDDETRRRAFGELKPAGNPWAGYYVYAGNDDDRFAHLVINDAGRFWIYHSRLNAWRGSGAPNAAGDAFEGAGDTRMDERMRMALRRGEGGLYRLDVDFGYFPKAAPKPASMKKTDPPRFPRSPSARDEVRFVGVFSGTYGERNGAFWLTQVWLWESGGEWWGQYLRDHYKRGLPREFISTEEIEPVCSEQCKVLSFKTSRGQVKLTRVSADEIVASGEGEDKAVTLRREETLPGFFLDLAPVATRKENREWIKAMTTAGMITWSVPGS
jgi:hypothetical protein